MAVEVLSGNEEIIQKLMRIPMLKTFAEEDLEAVLRYSRLYQFEAGELIFDEGTRQKVVYYLVSGRVRIAKQGKELMVLQRTGDVFGEMGAIAGDTCSASVYAIDPTSCIEMDLSMVVDRAGQDVHLFRSMVFRGFAEILAHRLRMTTQEVLMLKKQIETLKQHAPPE